MRPEVVDITAEDALRACEKDHSMVNFDFTFVLWKEERLQGIKKERSLYDRLKK